ncbi:cysteine/glutathione ABC transporter ATP-binding protein/permease CydC [Erwinia sp. 198]|uniref:heme ABC transporter ATP-binding protein/permease CydC n=1 Tax=Erwinia sp. 198 TaxID=2022746 RepID=UPI000F689CD4|nr:cysteine/glutathione ABC transporter ATP-binding protein/permease CydC [Erwinia sp. 198]RRZ92862.1 cysteine/glutathione ABC transporter ATP-binding protein/permease CydC [Erwinia sp. 198]
MKLIRPWLALLRPHAPRLMLGILLAVVTLLASIALLTLSGWFLAACSLAGAAGLYSFNYMLPAAGVRGAAILRTVARYAERLVSHDGTFRILEDLRVFTFNKLIPLSPGALARFQRGDLLNRLVADVDTLDHLYLRLLSPLLGALVAMVTVTLLLGSLNWPLALMLGGLMLATLLLLPPIFYRLGRKEGEALAHLRALYRSQLTGWLQSQAEMRIYGGAQRFRARLDNTEKRWLGAQRFRARLSGLSQGLLTMITGATAVLLLWSASALFHDATLALFLFCALAAFEALAPVGGAFLHLGEVFASARRVNEVILQNPAVNFPAERGKSPAGISLNLREVSFSYNEGFPVLRSISLDIAQGEHVALLGSSGCGKSTLLQLLTRARDPINGEIRLNDRPLAAWDETALREATGVVTQRVHLFNATLRDNLLLAAPDRHDDELLAMLRKVGLTTLINAEGLDAWLGEGGRQLSGGERRRLGLARALLHDGPLLLLDEPTEGLDSHTERQILTLLREAARGKTMIVVTHRPQGLRYFDKICLMESGTVVEQGTHVELISKRSRYSAFLQRITL